MQRHQVGMCAHLQLRAGLRQAVRQRGAAAAQRAEALAAGSLQARQQRLLGQGERMQPNAAGHVQRTQLRATRQRLAQVCSGVPPNVSVLKRGSSRFGAGALYRCLHVQQWSHASACRQRSAHARQAPTCQALAAGKVGLAQRRAGEGRLQRLQPGELRGREALQRGAGQRHVLQARAAAQAQRAQPRAAQHHFPQIAAPCTPTPQGWLIPGPILMAHACAPAVTASVSCPGVPFCMAALT